MNYVAKHEKNRKKGISVVKVTVIVILVLVALVTVDIIVSYKWIVTRTYEITDSKIKESFSAVLISDLHGNKFENNNEQIVKKIQDLNPDLILMDGDFVQSETTEIETCDLISQLIQIAPVYFSLGNQEESYFEESGKTLAELTVNLEEAGAVVLEQNYLDVVINDQSVRIGGMYAYAFPKEDSAEGSTLEERMDAQVYSFLMDFQNTDSFTIMMCHRPDSFIFGEASAVWTIDLVVSGHTHGGQILIPFVGGLWAPDQGFFPEYDYGLFQKDNIRILITTGLGSKTESLPRFNNPPEIVKICFNPE